MFSRINAKGIVIVVIVLVVVQFTVGFLISPIVKKIAVEMINKSDAMKIQIDGLKVWPVTLKVSVKGLKIFDPDGEERIINVDSAGCRLSFFGLLSRRIVFSKIDLNGVDINIEGEPDGSFNIEKLAGSESGDKSSRGIFDSVKGQDWFSRIYRIIEDRHSKEGLEQEKKDRVDKKEIKKEVVQLPKGRRVEFKSVRDDYVLVVKSLIIKNGKINVGENNQNLLNIDKVVIKLSDLAVDPEQGVDLGSLVLRGQLEKDGKYSGKISFEYKKAYKKGAVIADIDLKAKDIDLSAVSFIYNDSLPVSVDNGIFTVDSTTELINEDIESKNSVVLRDHRFLPKSGGTKTVLGFIPIQTLCEALNQTTPLKLEFVASGPVASPKISGFEKTLQSIVKPFMGNMIKDEGVSVVQNLLQNKLGIKQSGTAQGTANTGQQSAEQTINAIEALFKKK